MSEFSQYDNGDPRLSITASEIIGDLWLGNIRDAENLDFLRQKNIKNVINVCEMPPRRFIYDVNYSFYPILQPFRNDQYTLNMAHSAVRALELAHDLRSGMTKPTLIHCVGGIDRSPGIVYKYLKNIGVADPYNTIKKSRPIVNDHTDWW